MESFQVGDLVRHKDGGVVGKIISIRDGFAQVKFSTYVSIIALFELALMSSRDDK